MKILIFIHDSRGELDWIAPFVSDVVLSNDTIDIFLHNIGNNPDEVNSLIKDYNLKGINVNVIKFSSKFHSLLRKFEFFFGKISATLKEKSLITYKIFDWVYKILINLFSSLDFIDKKYDIIFRDYNLKDSIVLNSLLKHNNFSKIIVFPHAFGIQKLPGGAVLKTKPKKVKCDLWLENTKLSDRSKVHYKECFSAYGAPILSLNYKKKPSFLLSSNNVIVLLRDGYDRYGCDDNKAFHKFKEIIKFMKINKFNVYVKVHPRRSNIQTLFLNEINKYSNVELFEGSLINFNEKFAFCLTFFSTAGLLLTSRKVPVFDITEYRECNHTKNIGSLTHFCWEDKLTHYLLYYGMQDRLNNFNRLLDKGYLTKASEKQYNNLKKYYPNNTNNNIYKKLKNLVKV